MAATTAAKVDAAAAVAAKINDWDGTLICRPQLLIILLTHFH
jgi:hypothetical protein